MLALHDLDLSFVAVLQVNETLLKSIVTNPVTDYFFVDEFTGMTDVVNSLTAQTCNPCLPAPTTATMPFTDSGVTQAPNGNAR